MRGCGPVLGFPLGVFLVGWVVGVRYHQIYTMGPVSCRPVWVAEGIRGLLLVFYMMEVVVVVDEGVVPGVGLFECRHIRVRDLCLCSMMCMCGRWKRGRWMLCCLL